MLSYDMLRILFFFKQNTAYEMLRSLVGSKQKTAYEMLRSLVGSKQKTGIRDAQESRGLGDVYKRQAVGHTAQANARDLQPARTEIDVCLLYTSDAADDLTRVDLGGRRIIKKKK